MAQIAWVLCKSLAHDVGNFHGLRGYFRTPRHFEIYVPWTRQRCHQKLARGDVARPCTLLLSDRHCAGKYDILSHATAEQTDPAL